MQFGLKSIQEAVRTAPKGHVDMSHLDDSPADYGPDPAHQQALASAQAWQAGGAEESNEEEEEDEEN